LTLDSSKALKQIIEDFQVFHCIECGKCTGACPMAQVDRDFSPRLLAKHVIEKGLGSEYLQERIWACLTCGLCHERCPQGIPFADFVRAVRLLCIKEQHGGLLSHGGALQGLMRMQSVPGLSQNRLDWITSDLKTSSQGELLYFVGCLPYFGAFFSSLGLRLESIAWDTVRILNEIGQVPVVLPDERCCGHDLIWSGDEASFDRLRRLNMASFQKAGVKTIVTACGECSYTLKHLYPERSGDFPYEVLHISEYLEKAGFSGGDKLNRVATFQDPCRLGRFQGIYEAPRSLLASVLELREMRHFKAGSWCCGNSAWLGCDRYSKQMQVERLREAKETQGDLIVTACPKCQIHLTCAMRDVNRLEDFQMAIADFSNVMARSIKGGF
jgi:heterodisulfide reductase subunit D